MTAVEAERQRLPPAHRPLMVARLCRFFDFAHDRLPQSRRRNLAQRGRPQGGPHGDALLMQPRARRTRGEMSHHLGGRHRIELVVDVAIQHPQGERAVHRLDALQAKSIRFCNRSRPRASRDITVPIGMSTIALISL